MLGQDEVENYILGLPDIQRDYPFDEGVAVYKRGGEMFALINEGTDPLRISLKCDPKLSELLRAKYETVMPGHNLSRKHWNTILLTGQLGEAEIKDLIRHAYELVKNTAP